MNLVLLFDDDFDGDGLATVRGRRREHIAGVHRVRTGQELVVGVAGRGIGTGTVTAVAADALRLRVDLVRHPPPPLQVTLVLALPRPKVLNRVIAGATSMGIKRIVVVNAWRVEKSYWKSPRLSEDNLRQQAILGLEQAGDTMLPRIELRRFFRRFVEDELPSIAAGTRSLVAHPYAEAAVPRSLAEPLTLAIGPEGGFIAEEIDSLQRAGFLPVSLGSRILRVETALPFLIGRMK